MNDFSHIRFALKSAVIIIFAYFGGGLILSMISSDFLPSDYQNLFDIYSQGVLQLLVILLLTIALSKQSTLKAKQLLRFNGANLNSITVFFAILGMLGLQLFASGFIVIQENLIPEFLLDDYRELESLIEGLYTDILGGNSSSEFYRAMIIGALIPAFSEEFFFRGLFQKSLEQELKPILAVLFTSLIFTLLHFNPIGLVPLFVIGVYLGIITYITQNIWLPIIAHFVNNFLAILVLFNEDLSSLEDETLSLPITEALMIMGLGLTISLYSIYIIRKQSI